MRTPSTGTSDRVSKATTTAAVEGVGYLSLLGEAQRTLTCALSGGAGALERARLQPPDGGGVHVVGSRHVRLRLAGPKPRQSFLIHAPQQTGMDKLKGGRFVH